MKKYMIDDKKLMISYQPLSAKNLPNFFRIVFINPDLEENNIDEIIKLLEEYGDRATYEISNILGSDSDHHQDH